MILHTSVASNHGNHKVLPTQRAMHGHIHWEANRFADTYLARYRGVQRDAS